MLTGDYSQGSTEEKIVVDLVAGKKIDVLIEFSSILPKDAERSNSQPALMRGLVRFAMSLTSLGWVTKNLDFVEVWWYPAD